MKEGLMLLIELGINVVSYSFIVGERIAGMGSWIGGGLTWEYGMNRGLTSLENLELIFDLIELVLKGKEEPKLSSLKDCFWKGGKGLLSSLSEGKCCCWGWRRFCWEDLEIANPDQSGNWNCWLNRVGVLGSQENTSMSWKWWK